MIALGLAVTGQRQAVSLQDAGASHSVNLDIGPSVSQAFSQIRTLATPSPSPSAAAALPIREDPTPTPKPAPAVSVASSGCSSDAAHLIDVNLTTEDLTATSNGQVVFQTLITSGPPDLQTPTGCFSILSKVTNVMFYSPWPASSPYWYSPMFVAYAMDFRNGGFYLHTDPDEPDSAFGPGSQTGPYASHGCVHVPIGVMEQMYPWAPIGTAVYIHY